MNALKHIIYPIMSMLLALSLYQCAGAKQSELMKPLDIEAVYYKELDSINREIYVVVKLNSIPLDHMYFHGKKISLSKQNDILYSGVYQKKELVKEDFIMSDKPFA